MAKWPHIRRNMTIIIAIIMVDMDVNTLHWLPFYYDFRF
jgi:hypothetical protein